VLQNQLKAYRLVLTFPSGSRRLQLPWGESILGSDPGCDIVLPHLTVSRRHARLQVDAGGLLVEDLGSRNGTRLDGEKKCGPFRVEAGAQLEFGGAPVFVEQMEEGDLSPLALPLPQGQSPSGDPSLTSLTVRKEPALSASAPTVGAAAIEEFLLRRLPGLLELALGATQGIEVAQTLGTEFYRTFPCLRLEIVEEESGAVLFQARDGGGDPPLDLDLVHLGLRWRSSFASRELGRLLEPLARMGLTLIHAAIHAAPHAVGRGAVGAEWRARVSGSRVGETPPAGSSLPSLHHSTLDRRLQAILKQVERVARGDIGVLIRGESGTGKEVLARFVHSLSPHAKAPFVAINCAALPRDLLEAELFGIERAVATGVEARPGKFESAHGGTLFLDEIGDMALETQAKILRVLQEGEVYRIGAQHSQPPRPARPRIVAATNRDLEQLMEEGAFRRDLYYRVAGFEVRLPALRERSVDIPNLAARFLSQAGERQGLSLPGISQRAAEILSRYPWPGNIRELKHEIERAALFLQDGELLDSTALDLRLRRAEPGGDSLKDRLEAFERREIERALRACERDVPRAAEALGIGRSTLYRRMQILGIEETAGG
jgi:transcriptional regulator with AAA-type ATPase domain